jgi:hypothetical protein
VEREGLRGRGDERQSGRSYPTREESGLVEQTVQTDHRESTETEESTSYSQSLSLLCRLCMWHQLTKLTVAMP